MKRLLTILLMLIAFAVTCSSATVWFVNGTNGDDIFGTGSITNPMRTITGVVNTGALQDGDVIHIAAGTYTDSPTIPKNITINGHTFNSATEVVFDLSVAHMVFAMSGTTTFTLDDVGAYGLTAANRFWFTGSDNTGIHLQSGKVLLSTASFYVVPPFLFQASTSAASSGSPSTWYVDYTNGDDLIGNGTVANPLRSITGVLNTGALDDGDVIHIAAGTYTDHPTIPKDITINGHNFAGNSVVVFNLSSADMVFTMNGRTVFSASVVSPPEEATRFHFTGSMTSGIRFVSGCVHASNAIFDFTPPFLFQGGSGSTGIAGSGSLPENIDLMQCYPNPFNPSTVIRFAVGAAGYITLKVYDITGKEVTTLVRGMLQPGLYERTFDATGLASGVYVYRLQSGGFAASKKLVVMK